jgi:hypothetical protein
MKFTPRGLRQLRETYTNANNPTVLRLIEHIEELEEELKWRRAYEDLKSDKMNKADTDF